MMRYGFRRLYSAAVPVLLLFSSVLLHAQLRGDQLYWEYPEILVAATAKYPRVESGGGVMAVVWQEIERIDEDSWQSYLSLRQTENGRDWEEMKRFAGPFQFAGEEAPLSSVAIDEEGTIYVAVSRDTGSVAVYRHRKGRESFDEEPTVIETEGDIAVAPRIFNRADGGLILYITQKYLGEQEGTGVLLRAPLTIYYALSEDGSAWTDFNPLVTDTSLVDNYNLLPNHAVIDGQDFVVFQSLVTDQRTNSYQLFIKSSRTGGRTWNAAVPVSNFSNQGEEDDPIRYDNQRPFLASAGEDLGLVWERKKVGEISAQVYFTTLDADLLVPKAPEPVTRPNRDSQSPRFIFYKNNLFIFWFDNRAGDDNVFIAAKERGEWQELEETNVWFARVGGVATFPKGVILNDNLYFFWENRLENQDRIAFLTPDETVTAPVPQADNFRVGVRQSQDIFAFRWNIPDDSSGLAGFSYSVDRNPEGLAPLRIMAFSSTARTEVEVEEDGQWYFHLSAQDRAGNWSQTATLPLFRDTTPPPPVTIMPPELDERGFTISNTNTITWLPPEEDLLSGYSYRMEYLGPPRMEFDPETVVIQDPPRRLLTRTPEIYFRNQDNGLYAFSVSPIDSVGNFGEVETVFLRMNKYIVETYITTVEAPKDLLGRVSLKIFGRGFSVGGEVNQVILDRDGEEPFDYTYPLDSGLYTVETDRVITGPTIDDVEEGAYRIGLLHPRRGFYFTDPFLQLESTGTIKFGDFRVREGRTWTSIPSRLFSMPFNSVMIYLIFGFIGILILLSGRRIILLVREGRLLRTEVENLFSKEGISPARRKERIEEMRRRGLGLRVKFIIFITAIVILVVVAVSFQLGQFMINTQRQNLVDGLENQTEVLLESLVSGAKDGLRTQNRLALGLLLRQKSAMQDAEFVTITGEGSPVAEPYDYVWVTDDPDILSKIDGEELEPQVSLMTDELSDTVQEVADQVNMAARENVSTLVDERNRLGESARELALAGDAESMEQLSLLQDSIADLEDEIIDRLFEIGDIVMSYPEFSSETISEENMHFTFIKPIVDRPTAGQEGQYFRGVVRLGVSAERILTEIERSVGILLRRTAIIAIIAIALGIAGSIGLATIIIIPIRRLVAGLEVIRDTEDKEELKEHVINVRTRDEISALADTVNQMTQGLVKAAVASKDLTVGKEVQKMFIPLELDEAGNKASTGHESNDFVEFFGYYEGAKGVSGDYFDFRKLDEKHYGIIKCDVAGKGVPASLIMVEVATIFLNNFRDWSVKRDGIHLDKFAYSVNDLVEERGFKGRFAALIVVILNIETGECYLCNAGDNLVHMYDASRQSMWTKTLPEAPASGVFPSMLVEMQSGFQQVTHRLNHGDTMFLFTDGIEEAQRRFRNENLEYITCQEEGIPEGDLHDNHAVGSEFEELGIPRIHDLVNAVFRKEQYRLEKHHNPTPGEELVFDFTTCSGTVEDAVMAMVSVEKIFRLYLSPDAGADDRIMVDKKINEFLKKHFLQYDIYFSHPVELKEKSLYDVFSHVREDEQFDDLTILGVQKK